jgi:hypothetical protein
MYDSGKIITGIIIGFILLAFPFWFNLGKASKAPEPELTPKAKEAKYCVEPKEDIRAIHQVLLDEWRNAVVRDGNRLYVGFNGKTYEMSLQKTCMDCHSNKTKFCDQCHNYAGVTGGTSPYCWNCHLEPKEEETK